MPSQILFFSSLLLSSESLKYKGLSINDDVVFFIEYQGRSVLLFLLFSIIVDVDSSSFSFVSSVLPKKVNGLLSLLANNDDKDPAVSINLPFSVS